MSQISACLKGAPSARAVVKSVAADLKSLTIAERVESVASTQIDNVNCVRHLFSRRRTARHRSVNKRFRCILIHAPQIAAQ